MFIFEMRDVTDEVWQAFQRLTPQLTEFSPPPTEAQLKAMAESSGTTVFLARQPDAHGTIVGSATLGTFLTPTGVHGWIEDVVVDRSARRQGIGKALIEVCIAKARAQGLHEINLTSRPSRAAAIQLYQAMGFVQRETNVYRYAIK